MSETDNLAAWLETNGARHPIVENFGLGRASSNRLVITDDGVSRVHATIQQAKPGEFWLFDMQSKNGTVLNGRRIFFPVRLQPGDIIEIGDRKLVFRRREGDASAEPLATKELIATLARARTERCWLLMADIAKSRQLSSQRPQGEWKALLLRWFALCREAIEQAGGRIDKHTGDGFLAFWRMSAVTPVKVAQAAKAMRALQATPEAPFRVVLHCGEADFGGGFAPGEEITPGEAVDFIFRLEELAGSKGLEYCVSFAAWEGLDGCLGLEEVVGEHVIRGMDGTHRIFSLV